MAVLSGLFFSVLSRSCRAKLFGFRSGLAPLRGAPLPQNLVRVESKAGVAGKSDLAVLNGPQGAVQETSFMGNNSSLHYV